MNLRDLINLVESASADTLGVVAAVRELESQFKKDAKFEFPQPHFHLSECARCKAPVWKQPCPVCDYYPLGQMDDGIRIGSPEWIKQTEHYRASAFESFKRHIEKCGNIAAWFFVDYRKVVAYKENSMFATVLDKTIEQVKHLTFPDAESIWASYTMHITE